MQFIFQSLQIPDLGLRVFLQVEDLVLLVTPHDLDGSIQSRAFFLLHQQRTICTSQQPSGAGNRLKGIVCLLLPGVMAVVVPLIVGIVLGVESLGGLLSGALVTGVLMAIFMSNAGGAWDNAKKYIETGHHGGKGSEAHKAAVVGDTVGDPFKDTSGPSINILIKLMTIVSLVFAPLFLSIGGLL